MLLFTCLTKLSCRCVDTSFEKATNQVETQAEPHIDGYIRVDKRGRLVNVVLHGLFEHVRNSIGTYRGHARLCLVEVRENRRATGRQHALQLSTRRNEKPLQSKAKNDRTFFVLFSTSRPCSEFSIVRTWTRTKRITMGTRANKK